MAVKSLFPEEMISKSNGQGVMSLESIASKLTYFHEQLHLLHWQTTSYAEHQALGGLYDYVHDFKDGLIEKLMGYTGRRPTSMKVEPIMTTSANAVVDELMSYASSLKSYAEINSYHDISNLADALSGEAAKVRYLLTLS
jgi:DNA-binding ferritin-like protein